MARLRVGVIAESDSDCDTIATLIRRITAQPGNTPGALAIRKRASNGCSRLRHRAARWMAELANDGCTAAVLVHDLDRNPVNGQLNDEETLMRELAALEHPRALRRHICIPVEEIEAWFFASAAVMARITGAKAHPSPHRIERPKERLIAMSRGANRRPRYSPNDNPMLAEMLELDACATRCPAFRHLRDFVHDLL
jgi:hypothetical protein